MERKANRRPLQVVFQDGQPSAVILDLQEYVEILERIEDVEDLRTLSEMRSKPLEFTSLERFLEEGSQGV